MDVESRDSVSLKPAELDELGQLVSGLGLPLQDEQLDTHIEQFPLVAVVEIEGEIQGFLFGSLERIGGTPCILWGLGGIRRGKNARASLDRLVAELYRRAAISFPDEDVLVAGRVAHPAAYTLFGALDDVCPRPKYSPNGEERAWGRRLAKRFGVDGSYDEQSFVVKNNGQSGFLDHESLKPDKIKPEMAALFSTVNVKKGGSLIAHGWVMAEELLKLGAR